MIETTSGATTSGQLSEAIRSSQFETSKYGRGYDKRMVNAFLDEVAQAVGALEVKLDASAAEVRRLEQRVIEGPRGEEVVQAVKVISNAQRTADGVVAEADAYSARVVADARAMYDDATRRVAQLEEEAQENVRRLAVSAEIEQHELDKQTAYLRTLRDASRTQMEKFLSAMLDHITGEYGRAHPTAAQAASTAAMIQQPTDETGREGSVADTDAEDGSVHVLNRVHVDSVVGSTASEPTGGVN